MSDLQVRTWPARLAVAFVAFFALGVLYAGLSATVLHGDVTGDSLGQSVEREIGVGSRIYDDDTYGCEPAGAAGGPVWTCVVPDSDSGRVGYRVEVRNGGSCWDARIASSDPEQTAGMPARVSGCVRRWELGVL